MKKFFTALLWIGLAVSLIALVSVAGERTALRDEAKKGKQKYDALKTMYDREKTEWQSAADELNADNTALALEKQALAAALTEIRQEMDTVKAERETLAAEKNEASGRLSEIMAVLMPETAKAPEDAQNVPLLEPPACRPARPEPLPL